MPSFNRGYLQLSIGMALRKLDRFSVVTSSSIEIAKREYVPDVCAYSKRKINRLQDIVKMTEMPLLVVEILSSTQGELIDKFKIYFKAGILSCWLVDPLQGSVMVFSGLEKASVFTTGELIDEILDIRISLADIFN